jgi:hypothetical protein
MMNAFIFVHWFVVDTLLFTLSGDGEFVEGIEAPAKSINFLFSKRKTELFAYHYSRVKFEKLYLMYDLDHER